MNRLPRRAAQSAVLVAAALAASACGGGNGEPTPAADETSAAPTGDPGRGEKIFMEQGCGNCHAFEAAGTTRNVGPNLDQVVAKYDEAFIRESIVDPNAYIEKGVGGSIGGDTEYGTEMGSYGPDAEMAANRLTEQELADLIAYLTSAKGG